MAEIVGWFTVNGTHIPIYEGEKKSDAIRRHTQEKTNEYLAKQKSDIEKNKKTATKLNEEEKKKDEDKHKQKQLDIINKTNKMTDDYHTGIRKVSDIQTWKEALKNKDKDESLTYPDFTEKDANTALNSGYVTVYSSKSIKNGVFVSPSKMMAQDYAGSGKVQSMRVSINDVAWINLDEGVFAKIK